MDKNFINISVIIQYNTNELAFLEANLIQCTKLSEEIIVVMCSHLFNGENEDDKLIEKTKHIINKYSNVKLLNFPFDKINMQTPTYWHNLSRFLGFHFASNDWVLFLDADEIPSTEFKEWFEENKYGDMAYDFTCYWYFREATYQASTLESAGFLVRKKHCVDWNLHDKLERKQFYQKLYDKGKLVHGNINPFWSKSGKILMHHFSWVRNKQQMMSKVLSWGHRDDKDWVTLVEDEFNRPFNGVDFVHGYSYNIVENEFNIIL